MFDRTFGAALFSAAVLFIAPFANAQSVNAQTASAQTASVSIRTTDLNLTTEAGRATLDARIAHAVDRICGDAHSRSTWAEENYASCARAARAEVKGQVEAAVTAAEKAQRMAGQRDAAPIR